MSEETVPNRVKQFFEGLSYPLRAFKLMMSHFSILKFAIMPLLINTVIFIAVFTAGHHFWGDFISRLRPAEHAWYLAALLYVAYALAWVFGFIIYLLLCFIFFTFIGNLIAAPFLDLLSERTEWICFDKAEETPFSLFLFLRDVGMVLFEELRKMAMWLFFMICILPLLLIPVVGQIFFAIFSTTFTVYFLGVAFVDFPLARRRQPFSAKREFGWRMRYRILGFGAAVYATLIIPVVGFACLPLSTVGGTMLFCEYASDEEKRFLRPDLEKPEKKNALDSPAVG